MGSPFYCIGFGSCGSVWSSPYTEVIPVQDAYKRADGSPRRSILNDQRVHQLVLLALDEYKKAEVDGHLSHTSSIPVSVPQYYKLIAPDDSWWPANASKWPEDYKPCNTLHVERIPPFSKPVRELLIENYCSQESISRIKNSEPDRDCLIRPYLGRRRMPRKMPSKSPWFSLRNYPLHLDQLEQLVPREDIKTYSKLMGRTLAILHWLAEVDANDVEFVLAPPRNDNQQVMENALGKHVLWILDFDLCGPMATDDGGVESAVRSFLRNDPFFPRPEKDVELWKVFREEYLNYSSRFLDLRGDETKIELPRMVMDGIEDACRERDRLGGKGDKPLEEYANSEAHVDEL